MNDFKKRGNELTSATMALVRQMNEEIESLIERKREILLELQAERQNGDAAEVKHQRKEVDRLRARNSELNSYIERWKKRSGEQVERIVQQNQTIKELTIEAGERKEAANAEISRLRSKNDALRTDLKDWRKDCAYWRGQASKYDKYPARSVLALLETAITLAMHEGKYSKDELNELLDWYNMHGAPMLYAPSKFPWPMERPADPEGMTRLFNDKREWNKKIGNPLNNCLPYSDAESDAVKYYYEMGQSPADIAEVFGRTIGAINSHLSSLGMFS